MMLSVSKEGVKVAGRVFGFDEKQIDSKCLTVSVFGFQIGAAFLRCLQW